ncbi:MAG: undecaprenyl-phosphate glucose phosphotransferase [Pseudomonadota bacterium]
MSNYKIYQRNYVAEQFFRLADILSISISLFIALQYITQSSLAEYMEIGAIIIIIFILSAESLGIYRHELNKVRLNTFTVIISSCVISFLLLLGVGYISNTLQEYSREAILLCFALMPFLMLLWRVIFHKLVNYISTDKKKEKVAILGVNLVGSRISNELTEEFSKDYELLGFYDDRTLDDERTQKQMEGKVYLGRFKEAIKDAKKKNMDIIYIVLPMVAEARITPIIDELADSTVKVHIIPDFFVRNLLHFRWHNVGSFLALSVYDTPFYGIDSFIKRLEDIVIGSLILTLILPPMLVIAIAVKITSPGPVIFKQKRYGIGGKEVTVYKFRSMKITDNDSVKVQQASKNDSRLSPIGSFIRRTSLDELPQFINVLQGSMSIVGPRPHAIVHNEYYRKEIEGYMLRHMVKPGITGWAQVNGYRGETKELYKMEKRVEYDLFYIRNWSIFFDMKIIFMTIFKGFINKNAY